MILINSIRTPDGTILESESRHDFKLYKDTITGKEYGVDGGISYCRYIGDMDDCDILSIDTDFDEVAHEIIREHLKWGTYGIGGKSAFRRVALKDLSNPHIEAILETQKHISEEVKQFFKDELIYRKEKEIYIED